MFDRKPHVKLVNWFPNSSFGDNYCLAGAVYGHPRFEDGTRVYTSRVMRAERFCEDFIFETRNTIYHCSIDSILPELKEVVLEFLDSIV